MSRYRLIALDLDGTLLNSSMRLSETNTEAVRRAMDAGLWVVLATSRWYGLAKRTAETIGCESPLQRRTQLARLPDREAQPAGSLGELGEVERR